MQPTKFTLTLQRTKHTHNKLFKQSQHATPAARDFVHKLNSNRPVLQLHQKSKPITLTKSHCKQKDCTDRINSFGIPTIKSSVLFFFFIKIQVIYLLLARVALLLLLILVLFITLRVIYCRIILLSLVNVNQLF